MPRSMCRFLPASVALLVVLTAHALAGPLTPPVGPVASTSKPIGEIEPRIAINSVNTPGDNDVTPSVFRITQPGSYYLTSNFTVPSATRAIEITANNVTIDLNGFTITGQSGSTNAIAIAGATDNISILNGTIQSFTGTAVNLLTVSNGRIENLLVQNGTSDAIRTANSYSIRNTIARFNSGSCFVVGSNTSMDACSALNNSGDGFNIGSVGVVRNCLASANLNSGFIGAARGILSNCTANQNNQGFSVSSFSLVTNCNASFNTADGFVINSNSTVMNCNSTSNGTAAVGAGFNITGNNVRVESNNAVGNDIGFLVASNSNLIIRNSASGNTTAWNIAAGNAIGPIVSTVASAAVNGSTGASSLNTTDPNANFSY